MAQDSAFLLDFNLVFGYGLIFFTSSVNLIVSVNFSVNFADTFQLILFIDAEKRTAGSSGRTSEEVQ